MSELSRAMAVLATEHRAASAPVGVGRAVLAEFDAARKRRVWRMVTAGAVAAAFVGGLVLMREQPVRHPAVAVETQLSQRVPVSTELRVPQTVETRRASRVPRRMQVDAEEPFVAIPYTVPLAPEERATVMHVALSPSAIAAIGFPLPVMDPGSVVETDLLVGEDGRAHAVRILDRQE
jgi:hypothetical protein